MLFSKVSNKFIKVVLMKSSRSAEYTGWFLTAPPWKIFSENVSRLAPLEMPQLPPLLWKSSTAVTYWPTLSKLRGGPVKKSPCMKVLSNFHNESKGYLTLRRQQEERMLLNQSCNIFWLVLHYIVQVLEPWCFETGTAQAGVNKKPSNLEMSVRDFGNFWNCLPGWTHWA